MTAAWQRVSRGHPCPICDHPDWCLVAADGSAAICPRVESPKRAGEAGWLHRLTDQRPAGRIVHHVPLTRASGRGDLARLADQYRADLDAGRLYQFAGALGLSMTALCHLRVGWSEAHGAYSFPMRDATSNVVGIRLRRPDGRKFAVRGGREGLFLPEAGADPGSPLIVVEGPTDAAALLDLGFANVAGRPSCTGGTRLLCELVRRRRPSEVVVIADADEPGRRGAGNLASVLVCYAPEVRVIEPPSGLKDVRDWKRAGGTRADVEQMIGAAPVRRLRVVAGRASR